MPLLYGQGADFRAAKRIAADYAQWAQKKDVAGLFRQVLQRKEATLSQIIREFWQLSRGPGKLSIHHYFRYQLYRRDIPTDAKRAFLADSIMWLVCERCSSPHWRAATEDKWLSYLILQAAGIAVPATLAVFDPGPRSYGGTRQLRNARDIEKFLGDSVSLPLFVKPNDQLASFGATVIEGFDELRARLSDGSELTPEQMIAEIFADRSYLFQTKLENHPDLGPLSTNLATLRLVNFVQTDGILTPFAVLKIPGGQNIADNFWRSGNMLADIDCETGTITRIVRGTGPDQEELSEGLGTRLPDWPAARALNEQVARLFAPVAFNSLDIALTPRGPVVVEVNSGGAFDLPQVASGRGFLTPAVTEFFADHGWPKRRRRQ